MKVSRKSFLATLSLSLFAFQLPAQEPKAGASLQIRQDSNAIQEVLAYWTPARRASAVAPKVTVDPLAYTPQREAAAGVTPQMSSRGAGPSLSASTSQPAVNLFDAANLPDDFEAQFGKVPDIEKAAAAIENQAAQPNELEIEPTGFNYPYPYTRFNVLPETYRQNSNTKRYPYTTIGKLFFRMGTTDYVCSASVIRPKLLLTARHCIFDYPSGRWATNVVFYPGYYSGSNADLGGAWVARWLYTWVSNAPGFQYDIGFVQMFNSSRTGCAPTATARTVDAYTGYLGYLYGGDFGKRQFNEFGYPASSPFNGSRMVESQSASGALNMFGEANTIEVGSDMTGGCSGGPWITSFNAGVIGAANYATGVNSFKWTSPNHSRAINSPQFLKHNFYDLMVGALSLSCP